MTGGALFGLASEPEGPGFTILSCDDLQHRNCAPLDIHSGDCTKYNLQDREDAFTKEWYLERESTVLTPIPLTLTACQTTQCYLKEENIPSFITSERACQKDVA